MTGAAPIRPLRICVLGNSHVGALRRGWEALQAERVDIQPVFFASPGRSLATLERHDDRLVPTTPGVAKYLALTSGGLPEISLGDFDAFLLVGMAFLMPQVDRRHSSAVLRTACQDAWSGSVCARMVALVRASSQVPLLVLHNPLPISRREVAHLQPATYADTLHCLEAGVVPPGVTLLPQPAATRAEDWLTQAEFSAGATTLLGEGVAEDNATHMNARFGELQWRSALECLQPQVPVAR